MEASLGRLVPGWYRPERHRFPGEQFDARTRASTHRRGGRIYVCICTCNERTAAPLVGRSLAHTRALSRALLGERRVFDTQGVRLQVHARAN